MGGLFLQHILRLKKQYRTGRYNQEKCLTHDNFENIVAIIEGSVGANDATSWQRWTRETICSRVCTLTKYYRVSFHGWKNSASSISSAEWS